VSKNNHNKKIRDRLDHVKDHIKERKFRYLAESKRTWKYGR